MNQKRYFECFREEVEHMCELTSSKNHDYAHEYNAFLNFEAIESLSSARISAADGILTRMTDKLQRVINLLGPNNSNAVKESVSDTLRDLAVYSIILKIYIEEKAKNDSKELRQSGPQGESKLVDRPHDWPPDQTKRR